MEVLFNNNFKFHHKNSASPSLCLYSKNIGSTDGNPGIQTILNTLNYKQDDFKYFFKIWPHINRTIICPDNEVNKLWIPIRDMWVKKWSGEWGALEYEKKVYHLLDGIKGEDNYTVTPILSDSNKSKISDFAGLLGNFKEGDKNFELFVWIFIKWLKDPRQPSKNFNYGSANVEVEILSDTEKKLVKFIYDRLTFSCIMTPVIMGDNVTTFKGVINNSYENLIVDGTSIKIVMKNFCDIFVNVVKGIKNLKERNIAHNDLHYCNIFVQRLPDDTYNTFIYDFDRSYSPTLGNNPLLNTDICKNLCRRTQCNMYDIWFDFFKILHYILNYSPEKFQILLLKIITGNPVNYNFDPFIELMEISSFFTTEDDTCSWYWNTQKLDEIKNLLNNYDTIIERLNAYRTGAVSFAFVAPDNKNGGLFVDKFFTNNLSTNKLTTNKFDKKNISSNKLSIDLITGKYIDLSIKRPQRTSTVINTIKKFEDIIEENNSGKEILRKEMLRK
jgi:hypothetical protein